MWSEVYSKDEPAMTAWALRNKFGKQNTNKRVCFKEIAIGIYGPAAPVTGMLDALQSMRSQQYLGVLHL